ncbi:hypothetical protein GT646_18935 [Clostridium butyricum]|uniref:hypothetical protein n=1 Tax=Clostridium butyricum TaxID=1492 RepID=UPI00136C9EF0|nr:hypothetical protein [Clostridium butyricum]MZI82919.1 hypothetical protein [Clostridium butyricum]
MENTIKEKIIKNKKKQREKIKYKTKRKVKKDTLYYITQKLTNKITDKALEEQDDYFKSEYQSVKRIKKLILDTYPFEELKDIRHSSKKMYELISLVYNNNNFKNILDKIKYNEELDIHEKREYFKSIEYLLGKEYLEKHPEYNTFKNIMILLDEVEDIQQSVEYDFDIIEFIDNNSDDIEIIKDYLHQYKEIMLISLGELRKKMQLHMLEIKRKQEGNEENNIDYITYTYNEVEKNLSNNISIVNEKVIIIDCMNKTIEEIKKEGYLNNLPIDEVLYVNLKMPNIVKK